MLREASDRNLRESWRSLAGGGEGMVVEEDDEVLMVAGGADVAFFNPAFVKDPGLSPDRVMERLTAFYGPRRVPYLVWVMEGSHPELVERAPTLGLTVSEGPPAMVLDPITPHRDDRREGLVVEPVRDASGVADALELAAAGFGMPLELCRKILTPAVLDDPTVQVVVARVGGEPVSTATLVVTDEVAGIYTVATPEAHRGHGYGAAVTAAVVEEGRARGCTMASLQASPMGAPVYERMGFRTVAGYHHLVGAGGPQRQP
jgi:GNAT superfamily N-acetyltransferase